MVFVFAQNHSVCSHLTTTLDSRNDKTETVPSLRMNYLLEPLLKPLPKQRQIVTNQTTPATELFNHGYLLSPAPSPLSV
jgi:hypothetical protein